MNSNTILLVLLMSFFSCYSNVGASESYYKTINLDAVDNCISTTGKKGAKNLETRAARIELPAGEYEFECASGAISKWPDEATAHSQNREPWLCFAQVAANGVTTIIGRDWGYADPKTAIEKNKERQGEITLEKSTTVYLWIEDSWQGVDYCDDNRGTLKIGIRKIR